MLHRYQREFTKKRDLVTTKNRRKVLTYGPNSFTTHAWCNGYRSKIIIEHQVRFNIISADAFQQLGLTIEKHVNPYTITWDDMTVSLVDFQCLVPIQLNNIKTQIWCDVMNLEGFDLLLGDEFMHDFQGYYSSKPWYYSFIHRGLEHIIYPRDEKSTQDNTNRSLGKLTKEIEEIQQKQKFKEQTLEPILEPKTCLGETFESNEISHVEPTLQVEPSPLPLSLGPIPTGSLGNQLESSASTPNKEPMVIILGNDEPQLDLDPLLRNQDLENSLTQLELESPSLPKEHLEALGDELKEANLDNIKELEQDLTIHLIRDSSSLTEPIGIDPYNSEASEPLRLLELDHKEPHSKPLEFDQPLNSMLELGDSLPIPIGTQTLEELPTLPEITLSSPEYELGSTLELPKIGHDIDPNSPSIEILIPNTKTPGLAELNPITQPELACLNFNTTIGVKLPRHLTSALDDHSPSRTQSLEDTSIQPELDPNPLKKDLEPNLDPFIFPKLGSDLDPNVGSLALHYLSYRSYPLGPTPQTPRKIQNNFVISPLHEIEHIYFVVPDYFNSTRTLQPNGTNKVGRGRKFTVGTPQPLKGHITWNWSENIDCCVADADFTQDLWIPIIFDEEDPTLHKPQFFHHIDTISKHKIEDILEDQTQFTLDEHHSPEENFSHPGRADVGRRHNPRRYKWSLRSP